MRKKKLTKKQILENQIREDKKFRKYLIISIIILFLVVISVNIFYVFGCETKFTFRKYTYYEKLVSPNLICMLGNKLKHHDSEKFTFKNNTFFACSVRCKEIIIKHYNKYAFAADAFSGDTICKSDALIGLKEKGEPDIVYFKNKQNFLDYYNKN